MSVNVTTPCNMTCITLIYAALHYVTLPNIADMINKTWIVPSPTQRNIVQHGVSECKCDDPCNMTCITLIYAALHYVTLPNIADMINKTCIVPSPS
jgi:hypothetical protein